MNLENDRNAKFVIGEDHLLSISENGTEVDFDNYGSSTPYASYVDTTTGNYSLLVYLSSAEKSGDRGTVNTAIANTNYVVGSTNLASDSSESIYHPNYIILFRNGIYAVIYGYNNSKPITYSYIGDFKTIKANDDCLKSLLTVTDKDGNAVAQNIANDAYTNGVYKNFKKFLDRTYDTLKITNTWGMSGIYLGVFFGVEVLMGFIMWLLTRGKNNPNNYYSPWLTMKIQGRLGLAPGIITAIVGLFLTSYAPIIFISTIGLRVMWISMKELRPIQQ